MIGAEINNFKLIKKLGEGGFGSVYKAIHKELEIPYAVKILNVEQKEKSSVVERFRREAKAIASLNHPNIVRLIDFGWKKDIGYYLVMEFLKGKTLAEYIEEEPTISFDQIERWMKQTCSALSYIHKRGIIHRDIKPANIFVLNDPEYPEEEVKLIDFGIAALGSQFSHLTRTGFTMGSPLYMSPEQAKGAMKNIDQRSDLYSLGVVVFYLLSGRPPFIASSPLSVLYQHISAQPPKLAEVDSSRPWHPKLEAFIKRAMAKKKEDRPQSADEFFQELQEALKLQRELAPDLQTSRLMEPAKVEEALLPTSDEEDLEDFPIEAVEQERESAEEKKTRNISTPSEGERAVEEVKKKSSSRPLEITQLEEPEFHSHSLEMKKKKSATVLWGSILGSFILLLGGGLFFFRGQGPSPESKVSPKSEVKTLQKDEAKNHTYKSADEKPPDMPKRTEAKGKKEEDKTGAKAGKGTDGQNEQKEKVTDTSNNSGAQGDSTKAPKKRVAPPTEKAREKRAIKKKKISSKKRVRKVFRKKRRPVQNLKGAAKAKKKDGLEIDIFDDVKSEKKPKVKKKKKSRTKKKKTDPFEIDPL